MRLEKHIKLVFNSCFTRADKRSMITGDQATLEQVKLRV